jgi:hypothetical protein
VDFFNEGLKYQQMGSHDNSQNTSMYSGMQNSPVADLNKRLFLNNCKELEVQEIDDAENELNIHMANQFKQLNNEEGFE